MCHHHTFTSRPQVFFNFCGVVVINGEVEVAGSRGSDVDDAQYNLDNVLLLILCVCIVWVAKSVFDQLPGLKRNFNKSELFCFGEAQDGVARYAELFGCKKCQFPTKYLGIPKHYRSLKNYERKHVKDSLEKRQSTWKRKLLTLGGILILINSVLIILVLYSDYLKDSYID